MQHSNSTPITAEIQGASADIKQSTGTFDTVPLGIVSEQRLADILGCMTLLAPPVGDDVCYPNLIVTGPCGNSWFSIEDDQGTIIGEHGGPFTIAQAVEQVTGRPFTGVIPAHRPGRTAAGSPAPRPTAAPAVAASGADLEPAAAALVQLLQHPVHVAELRANYGYLTQGKDNREFQRLAAIIDRSAVAPELKARLKNYPPRYWALVKAGVIRRFFSFVLDIPLFLVVVGLSFTLTFGADPQDLKPEAVLGWLLAVLFLYFVVLEWVFGASPGGLLTGIRVVDKNGAKAGFWLCFGRQFLRIFRFGMMALTIALAGKMRTTTSQMSMGRTVVELGAMGGSEVVRR
jgi:uncharacterized RDD family membrane protein YckC